MNAGRIIRECIQQMAGTHLTDKVSFVDCNVDSIDMASGTCAATPIGEPAAVQIININLESDVADGLLIIPVLNSTITVMYSDRNVPYVFKYSDIASVFYAGTSWQFGDGTFGGLIKLVDPNNVNAGALARLNSIEQFMKTLQTAINGWAPVPNDGGAALKTALAAWLASTSPTTSRAELENTKVTQGA